MVYNNFFKRRKIVFGGELIGLFFNPDTAIPPDLTGCAAKDMIFAAIFAAAIDAANAALHSFTIQIRSRHDDIVLIESFHAG